MAIAKGDYMGDLGGRVLRHLPALRQADAGSGTPGGRTAGSLLFAVLIHG
jgi:hypothetical protein